MNINKLTTEQIKKFYTENPVYLYFPDGQAIKIDYRMIVVDNYRTRTFEFGNNYLDFCIKFTDKTVSPITSIGKKGLEELKANWKNFLMNLEADKQESASI